MKKFYCDICGTPFDPQKGGHRGDYPVMNWGLLGIAQADLDICPVCMELGKRVDFKSALLRAWREAADA